jgi:hypothetical protein
MGLKEVQAALARLFTDAAARDEFFNDPKSGAAALGLNDNDARALAEIAPKALARFAGSLKSKQILDARKRMPLVAQTLGARFADHWRAATESANAKRPVEEARAVAERLAKLAAQGAIEPRWIGDLARYEAAFVEASGRRFGVRIRWFDYPVAALAASLRAGDGRESLAPRRTLAVWARAPGGRLFHRAWPLWLDRKRGGA